MDYIEWHEITGECCLKCKKPVFIHPGYHTDYLTWERDLVLYRICQKCLPIQQTEDEMLLPPKKTRGTLEEFAGNTVWVYGCDSSWSGSQCDYRVKDKLKARLSLTDRYFTVEEFKAIRIFEHRYGPLCK